MPPNQRQGDIQRSLSRDVPTLHFNTGLFSAAEEMHGDREHEQRSRAHQQSLTSSSSSRPSVSEERNSFENDHLRIIEHVSFRKNSGQEYNLPVVGQDLRKFLPDHSYDMATPTSADSSRPQPDDIDYFGSSPDSPKYDDPTSLNRPFRRDIDLNSEPYQDTAYLEKMTEEFCLDQDESALISEINGERVVPVHGSGIWSYSGHISPSSELIKRPLWIKYGTHEAWLASAYARTAQYSRPGSMRPPVRWVLIESEKGQTIPENAIQTGTEPGGKLYSARAWWNGGVILGKAGHHLAYGGATISYQSIEYPLSTYEVLVGDASESRWVTVTRTARMSPATEGISTGYVDSDGLGDQTGLPFFVPVEGGRDADGTPLFIAQALYEEGWHPGRARLGEDHCCIGYGGGEAWVRQFNVLAYRRDIIATCPEDRRAWL